MSVPAEAEGAARAVMTPKSVTFTYDPRLAPEGSDAEYAARLLERAVSHVNVDVDGLVQRYLADVVRDLDEAHAEQLRLRTHRLITEALTAAQANLHRRLGIDLALSLLPRLERTTSP